MSTPLAYYSENDPFAAAWLRELMKDGLIMDGVVDTRSIVDVEAKDLAGFTRCHFFAGIGGWDYALQLAGWPVDRPVWTGSCPCQPFSVAGTQTGTDDVRHLWPVWHRLIEQCRPGSVFGEQVEAAVGHGWLDSVFDDLERIDYACGAVVLPAASVGAPHIRQRLWFVADSESAKRQRSGQTREGRSGSPDRRTGELGNPDRPGRSARDGQPSGGEPRSGQPADTSESRDVGDAECEGLEGHGRLVQRGPMGPAVNSETGLRANGLVHADRGRRAQDDRNDPRSGEANRTGQADWSGGRSDLVGMADSSEPRPYGSVQGGILDSQGWEGSSGSTIEQCRVVDWRELRWLPCRDGKNRATQPGLFPLAHGISNRVGTLRGAGNAIVPQVAAQVIGAFMEIQ